MNVTQGQSDRYCFPCLERCPNDVSQVSLDLWVEEAKELTANYQRLLARPSEGFWSTVLFNETFLKSFDAAVESLPKAHDHHLYRICFEWDDAIGRTASELRTTILAVYLRIGVMNKTLDRDITQKTWLEFVRDRSAMPLRRAASVWSHFPDKQELFVKVLKCTLKLDTKLRTDVDTLSKEARKMYNQLEMDVAPMLGAISGHAPSPRLLRACRLADEFLNLVIDVAESNRTTVAVLHEAGLLSDATLWISGIPTLVESVAKSFQAEVIFDMAMTLPTFPLKRLLSVVAQLEQSCARLLGSCLEVTSSVDKRYSMVQAALGSERFMLVLNETHPNLMTLLDKCEQQQRKHVQISVDGIRITQAVEAARRIERYGLLEGLGDLDRLDKIKREAVCQLMETLPHLSPAYSHLCLRHFDYDVTSAVESLLTLDSRLPMDLRRTESANLQPSGLPRTIPPISFEQDELVLSAISRPITTEKEPILQEDTRKNVFKGLFSMAPVAPKPVEAVPEPVKPVEHTKTALAMQELRGALDRLKMRARTAVEEGPNGERLVPMMTATKYAGASKFKISAADKVAIRPSYEKYKYETPNADNMYNDEYDDGFEQREFQVEPLNKEIESSSSDEDEQAAAAPAFRDQRERIGYGAPGQIQTQTNQGHDAQTNYSQRGGVAPSRGGGNAPRGGRNTGNQRTGGQSGGGKSSAPKKPAPETSRSAAPTVSTSEVKPPGPKEVARNEKATAKADAETNASSDGAAAGGEGGRGGGARGGSTTYTGGRDRQNKERHKNAFKQRGADRKMRGAF